MLLSLRPFGIGHRRRHKRLTRRHLRRGRPRRRLGDGRACAVQIAANGLGRAGSGRLVARQPQATRTALAASGVDARRDSRRRPVRARCTAPCCWTSAAHVVRPAIIWCDQRTEAECRWLNDTIGAGSVARAHLESRAHQFHAAEAALGARARARRVATGPPRAAAERLRALAAERRVRDRRRRRVGHADARRRAPRVVARDHRRGGIDAGHAARVFESPEICARVSARGGSRHRPARRARRSSRAPATRRPAPSAWASRGPARSARRSARPAWCSRPPIVRRSIRDGRLHTFCHAIPDRWHVMGVTQAAGLSLRWLRDQFGRDGSR